MNAIKSFLSYETKRNRDNAALYERIIKRAIGRDVKVSVLVGHHLCFEIDGDLSTENEIPSADCLMFDHEFMGKVFGSKAPEIMRELATVDCYHRDALLEYYLDHVDCACEVKHEEVSA